MLTKDEKARVEQAVVHILKGNKPLSEYWVNFHVGQAFWPGWARSEIRNALLRLERRGIVEFSMYRQGWFAQKMWKLKSK